MIDWLSAWLAPIQEILSRRGYRHSYIGGSSAREILDLIFFGSRISLRDLDIYLLKQGTAQPADIDALCEEFNGIAERGPLREKRRANPALPGEQCYDYLAGYGVHLYWPDRPIVSLSVLHRTSDLALNGLFDIDTIFLVVPNDAPFHSYADQVRQDRTGLILDPHDGYRAWLEHSPEIVHWAEVERCYARAAFRIVRSFAKAGRLRLPENLVREYRRRRPSHAVDNQIELQRDFTKVLGDRHWAEELDMLAELTGRAP